MIKALINKIKRTHKRVSLPEMLISIIFFIFFVAFIAQLLTTILYKRQQIVNNLQRMNINTILNLNHGSLVCYYAEIWAESTGIKMWGSDSWEIQWNEKPIWMLNANNAEWENDLCELLKAKLTSMYSINKTDNDRLLKNFFLVRTQVINVYTYKLVLNFAIDEWKSETEHIKRWTEKKEKWWTWYGNYLMQIFSIDYLGHILKVWANYNASAWHALDSLIKRIEQSWDLTKTKYSVFEHWNSDDIQRTDFWYKFQKMNLNLIDDNLIDQKDWWFPYNQILLQATYANWPFSYRDYYIYRNGQ